MSTVRLLSPSINLVDEVASLFGPAQADSAAKNDFSATIVVFPGKRPAHVLRKKLSQKIGTAYVPPRIFSIDLFVDYLCTDHLLLSENTIDEVDAVAILFELHSQMKESQRIGKEHFPTLETFYPVGVKLFSEMEELTIAAVTPEQLSQSITSVTVDSAHALSLLFEPFYKALTDRGYTTRAMKYQRLAGNISTVDFSRYSSLILAGFYAFTPSEETIMKQLLSVESVTMLFQNGAGIRSTLEQLGIDPQPEGDSGTPEVQFYESPDPHGQLFLLNRVLEQSFPAPIDDNETAAIILPSSENLFPLYHQTLSAYDQKTYNLALGYSLTRTPVYGFLMSLLDVVITSQHGEVYVPMYVQFLLHPYTKNILYSTRADITRILVHAVEDECRKHGARIFIAPERIERDAGMMEAIVRRLQAEDIHVTSDELRAHLTMIHDVTLRSLLNIRTVGEFAAGCIGVLQFINEKSTAHRHPYFHPFLEAMLDRLDALRRSLLAGHSFGSLGHHVLFLKQYIASAEVPFTGTPLQGLQVLGFLETRGLQFEHVMMIDVNDEVMPGKAQQDVILPLTVREQLGLSTYRDQERIKAYLFDVLRNSAQYVHYFYINDREKEPSRFIQQLLWKEQLTKKNLRAINTHSQEYSIDLSNNLPSPIVKTPEMIPLLASLQLSTTALDTYLTCGLQFYYRYVLRLKETGSISGDVEQSDLGSVVHAILHEYFAPLIDTQLTAEALGADRLRTITTAQFESLYGGTQFGEQFITRRQTERHLTDFLELYQRPMVRNNIVTIDALEEKLSAEIGGFQFIGSADRIEQRSGNTFIIDYKTGQNESYYVIRFGSLDTDNRDTWKAAIGTVQLVIYVMMYSAIKNVKPESVVPVFLFLGKKDLSQTVETPLFDSAEEMQKWYPALTSIVLSLAKEINDPAIPFTPTADIKTDCPECPYRTICGTQWTEKFKFI